MSIRRPRFTVRWLMVAVAIVALGLALAIEARRLSRLSGLYRRKAEQFAVTAYNHSRWASDWEQMAAAQRASAERLRRHRLPDDLDDVELMDEERDALESLPDSARDRPVTEPRLEPIFRAAAGRCEAFARSQAEMARTMAGKARHYESLRRKYDRAAARPWIIVPPDPPEPR